ncbi:5052_t:CDS:2, partial [Cetraspora pellucida]
WFRHYYEQKEKLAQEEAKKIIINLQTKFEETYIKFYYKHLYTDTSIERITSTSPDLDYQSDEDYHQYAFK